MPPRLIVNADDFGLTPGINRAIAELHRAGALTSATLMANGPAFANAVAVAHQNPALGVGCHLVFTDGSPVSNTTLIPSLLDRTTRAFHPTLSRFLRAVVRGAITEDDLVTEGSAQVSRLQAAGITVTHLDTHKHTHMFPLVTRALLRIARRCHIHAIRNPFEPAWCTSSASGSISRGASVRLLRATLHPVFQRLLESDPSIRSTQGALAVAATGALTQRTLQQVLSNLRTGTWELVVHPGYNDSDLDAVPTRLHASREVERLALLSEIPGLCTLPNAPSLIHYGLL